MKGLYLLLDGITLFFPLILSFDSKVAFYKKWKTLFLSSTLIAIPFLIWDAYFTANGVWGFNESYLVGVFVAGLPIEEILFFWVVPFACLFIYECCGYYLKHIQWHLLNKILQIGLILYLTTLVIIDSSGWYTLSIVLSTVLVMSYWKWKMPLHLLGIAFVISLLPFLVVNGVLTGSFIDAPIVWYSDDHITGIRIVTIPAEDIAYSFTLIGGNVLLFEFLQKRMNFSKPKSN